MYFQQEFFAGQLDSVWSILTAATEMYIGYKGKSDFFSKAVPVLWPSLGALISIVGGGLAGVYSARKAVFSIVDSSYWQNGSGLFNDDSLFDSGYDSLGAVVGMTEELWLLSYLTISVLMVFTPFYLAEMLANYLDKYSDPDSNVLENNKYGLFTNGFIIAISSWAASYIMNESVDRMVGWFKNYNTDAIEAYRAIYGSEPNFNTQTAIIYDVFAHTLMVIIFAAFVLTTAGSSWAYVYFQLSDDVFGTTVVA